jgi:cytochrome d ubiquinol oxidase subunit II
VPDLGTIWFLLLGVLIVGYVVLDGFDLGAGILHLFVARDDRERRVVLASIGPVWDGNEVWLLTAGGALFAAFPAVYATVFSGFYLALVLLLVALIVRAASMEFRSRRDAPAWRQGWDVAFAVSSFLPALLLGVAIGNVVRGIPIDPSGAYRGGLVGLLNPYALISGLLAVAVVAAHGAGWLVLKTDGRVQLRARAAAKAAWAVALGLWVVATLATALEGGNGSSHLDGLLANPLAWIAPTVFAGAWILFRRFVVDPGREMAAFVLSGSAIAALMAMVGQAIYPNLVPGLGAPERSLTIDNAASSDLTLSVMLVIALIGMPIVVAYTAYVYWTFRGKTSANDHGY